MQNAPSTELSPPLPMANAWPRGHEGTWIQDVMHMKYRIQDPVLPELVLTCIDNQAITRVGVAEFAAPQQNPFAVQRVRLSPPLQHTSEAVHAAVGLLAGHFPWSRGHRAGVGCGGNARSFVSSREEDFSRENSDFSCVSSSCGMGDSG